MTRAYRQRGASSLDQVPAWERVYRLVRLIPLGKVMTYGQIALYLEPLSARAVGWAMRSSPSDVPWQRVVNSRGGCSTDRLGTMPPGLQRALLEEEGIEFDLSGRLDLARHRWIPPREVLGNPVVKV